METREAVERIEQGEKTATVADATGIPDSTLRYIVNDDERRAMYFYGETDDARAGAAIDELGELPELELPDDNLDERVRAIVRDEVGGQ